MRPRHLAASPGRRAPALAGVLAAVALVLTGCGSGTSPTTTSSGASTAPPGTTTTAPATQNPASVTVQVWFLDEHHAATGQEPLFRPVARKVHPPAVAGAALDALFAGPTPSERAEGLRLVTSGATGYRSLHISGGVASVTLVGGCSSGGSTMTVAGEIIPTLKQFATVQHVKIFAPDGTTETPAGGGDSIPFCLEP